MAFDYYTYGSYHPTPTSIYFIGSRGEQIYTYRYDKTSHSVSMVKRKGIITERRDPFVQHYGRPLYRLERTPAAPQKQQLLDVIARTGEEDNPILLIAVLK